MLRDNRPIAELENAHFSIVFRSHRPKNGTGEAKLEATCPQALCLPILNKQILILSSQE